MLRIFIYGTIGVVISQAAIADTSLWVAGQGVDASAGDVLDGQGAVGRIGFDVDFLQSPQSAFRFSGSAGFGRLDEDARGGNGKPVAVTAYRRSLNGELRGYWGPSFFPPYSTIHIGLGGDYWSNVSDDLQLLHPLQETFQAAYARIGGGFQVGSRAYFEFGAKYPFSAKMKEYGLDNIGLTNSTVSMSGKVTPYARFDFWLAKSVSTYLYVDQYSFKQSDSVDAGATTTGRQVQLYLPAYKEINASLGFLFKF